MFVSRSLRSCPRFLPLAIILGLIACANDAMEDPGDAMGTDGSSGSDARVFDGSDAEPAQADADTPDVAAAEVTPGDTVADASGVTDGTEPGGGDLLTYCAWYKTCGGIFYDTAEDCAAASIDYWGECRRPWLDAFGACMLAVSCEDWGDPDLYNPADTPCAAAYRDIEEAPCP